MQGLLHPLQTPSHLILIVSLSFLIGQIIKNQQLVKYILILFITAALGVFLNQNIQLPKNYNMELILLTTALIVGLLIVIRFEQSNTRLLGLIIALSGIFLGYDSSPVIIPGLGSNSIYNWIAGAVFTVIISTSLLSISALLLRPYWDGIILRVIGSWVATSALFTLTLSFAPQ